MNKLFNILSEIEKDPECILLKNSSIEEDKFLKPSIPSDFYTFYKKYSGLIFFPNSDYSIEVVPPEHFVRANQILIVEECKEDISYNWFIFATSNNQYIDLAKDRLGRCYDSFGIVMGFLEYVLLLLKTSLIFSHLPIIIKATIGIGYNIPLIAWEMHITELSKAAKLRDGSIYCQGIRSWAKVPKTNF